MAPLVSVIIPVRGDHQPLARLLAALPAAPEVEVIVSLARPAEPAFTALRDRFPHARWVETMPGRGPQQNAAAHQARGEWLWFLHADSTLPDGWLDAFRALETTVAGGAFRFALDSSAWQARVLERAVALRVRWFDLPYGDQGIFVRRDVFARLGGFAAIPLMEDVEFVRRLTRTGPMRHLTLRLTTSARRWEAEGWLRRSAANMLTLLLYAVGVSPERLARRYYGQKIPGHRPGVSRDQGDAHQETR